MEKSSMALDYIHEKMKFYNYYDSFGSIILKSGAVLHIQNLFEYFNEYWTDYKIAKASGDAKEIKRIKTEVGSLLSNDEITIDIDDISATISAYKMLDKKRKKEMFNGLEEFFNHMSNGDT